ncbi:MAG TPA: hypothetical protein VF911_21975 [Thermoanaerobaculia bacterium]|jgi:hypothetical protein
MKRAGLPLSVGHASLPLRVTIAAIFAAVASVCIAGGVVISSIAAARVIAVLLVIPVGLIGVLAAAFVLAPNSRFGDRLDLFVPRLRERRIALATAAVLWGVAFALTI